MKLISAKLVKILANLDSVPKKGYNKNQNYYYVREVDVLEALKKELVDNKIILLTSSRFIQINEKPKTDKQDNKVVEFVTTVETSHRFIDSESGEELTINSVGSGYDSLDKGASKAITASVKYALIKTFMISDEGADIENDGETKQPPVEQKRTGFNRPALKTEEAPKQETKPPTPPPVAPPKEEPKVVAEPAAPKTAPRTFGKKPTVPTTQFLGHVDTQTEPKF